MKKVITKIALAAVVVLSSFATLEAKSASATEQKVVERLPSELTTRVRKSYEYRGSGSKRQKIEIITASVKVPFAKIGRRGKGSVEMIMKEMDKKKKITKVAYLKKDARIHGKMKDFLARAIDDFKKQQTK